MNEEQLAGKAIQVKGRIKEAWGRLSDDDIALYDGKREQFLGKLKEKYGIVREEAEDRLKQLEKMSKEHADKAA